MHTEFTSVYTQYYDINNLQRENSTLTAYTQTD